MAGPPNEYRTLRTINTLLLRGTGFSIAAKARKKTTRKRRQERRKKEWWMCIDIVIYLLIQYVSFLPKKKLYKFVIK